MKTIILALAILAGLAGAGAAIYALTVPALASCSNPNC